MRCSDHGDVHKQGVRDRKMFALYIACSSSLRCLSAELSISCLPGGGPTYMVQCGRFGYFPHLSRDVGSFMMKWYDTNNVDRMSHIVSQKTVSISEVF